MRSIFDAMLKADYIVVGQGIAGSVIGMTLHAFGKSVIVIDDPSLSSSSRIAAGVYNPFNFRRSIPTWRAKEAVAAAREFYTGAEKKTGAEFHSPKNILRIFGSESERAEWEKYLEQTDHLFAKHTSIEAKHHAVLAPFGCGIVDGGGVVDTSKFLHAVRMAFTNRGYYMQEKFDFSLVNSSEDNGISYGNKIESGKIVFCEGHLALNNPYFDPGITAPTKGELIHVKIPGLNADAIVNGPVYLVPIGDDTYICGATFNPGKADENTTPEGESELLSKLRMFIDLPCTVVKHFAGVRPAGRDRKPVLGISKKNRNVAIFNGFGSKGVLLAPYLAQLLVNHMENETELPAEISLARFKAYK